VIETTREVVVEVPVEKIVEKVVVKEVEVEREVYVHKEHHLSTTPRASNVRISPTDQEKLGSSSEEETSTAVATVV